jgi:hypothetical protein
LPPASPIGTGCGRRTPPPTSATGRTSPRW